jgi:hypothetical protein
MVVSSSDGVQFPGLEELDDLLENIDGNGFTITERDSQNDLPLEDIPGALGHNAGRRAKELD